MARAFRASSMLAGLLLALGAQAATVVSLDEAAPGAMRIHLGGGSQAWVEREVAMPVPEGESELRVTWDQARVGRRWAQLTAFEPAGLEVEMARFPAGQEKAVHWKITAAAGGAGEFLLSYPLDGLPWRVQYSLWLEADGEGGLLQGETVITNESGADLAGVALHLTDGRQHQADLAKAETLALPHLPPQRVVAARRLVYDADRYEKGVAIHLALANDAPSGLGDRRLLSGKARVFQATEDGTPIVVGEGVVPYLPVGARGEFFIGFLDGVSVGRKVLSSVRRNERRDDYGNVYLYDLDEEYQFEVDNTRDETVHLTVTDHIDGDWEVRRSAVEYEQTDAVSLEFPVVLGVGERLSFTYAVRRRNLSP